MAPLNILICGGGISGPSLAFWLGRAGHHITIIERFPALRAAGSQIDVRAQGIEITKRMGLLETIRSKRVNQTGISFVNSQNKVLGTILANTSGKGAQTLSSEYEIMRGDLVRVLYDATKHMENVAYIFGKTVEHFEQDDRSVTATFSDGKSASFDILIGADGQGSRIRRTILPPNTPDPLRRFGMYLAYWTIPGNEDDMNIAKFFITPRGWLVSGSVGGGETLASALVRDSSPEVESMPRASAQTQKDYFVQRFSGMGWRTDRLMKGAKATDSFYCHEAVQVRTDTWSKGRVVIVADAAHCPCPFTGMGSTSAFVGSYILAGEIVRNSDDIQQAFTNYERVLRPFVDEIQRLNPLFFKIAFPSTMLGVFVLQCVITAVCFLRIPEILSRFLSPEKGDWEVPEYPELKRAQR